ncbi:RNA12 protein-domain-containing protein [Peziza echinospora]|nr:RNA12 protein-domain-containing protein [Peziza echinospora]
MRTSGFRKLSTAAPPVGSSAGEESFHGHVIEDAISPDANGYIKVEQNESLLFFDNIFPLSFASWDLRYLIHRLTKTTLTTDITQHYLPPPHLLPEGFKVISLHPRYKDGGAFLKFRLEETGSSHTNPAEIERIVSEYLLEKNPRPWFSPFRPVRAFLVEGKPWTEDMQRFPSQRLKVEVTGVPDGVGQENLYVLFRRFGKIAQITYPIAPAPGTPPSAGKVALVQYLSVRSATAARNCLHRATFVEPGKEGSTGMLKVGYERVVKAHMLRDWLVNHPKIVIPILAAIIGTMTIAIFDPIRTWFIKAKITGILTFSEYTTIRYFWRSTLAHLNALRSARASREDPTSLLEERKDTITSLRSWLLDTNETFIIVQGPRGSGKKELILDHVLGPERRKNLLVIDCEPIVEAHGDSATIAAAANQVGYRPVFSWMNTITSLLDLAAQGTIGTSAGFSQTLEIQFNKILQNASVALRQVALADKEDSGKGASANSVESDEDYLIMHPEKRPVVVIDNFLHSQGVEGQMVYDRLSAWAALLVEANVAHIIFLTNDGSFSKSLSRSLPDRVFRSVQLGDASPESAKKYVAAQVGSDAFDEGELEECIEVLGGRLTDLEALSSRIREAGAAGGAGGANGLGKRVGPREAVEEIVKATAEEISKLYLSPESMQYQDRKTRRFSIEQAWLVISYTSLLLHPLFRNPDPSTTSTSGEDALQSLAHSDLVSVLPSPENSRPHTLVPGRPVYRASFARLMDDKVLKAKMDLAVLQKMVKGEEGRVGKWVEEMKELAASSAGREELEQRMAWLAGKIGKTQRGIEEWEGRMGGLREVIRRGF